MDGWQRGARRLQALGALLLALAILSGAFGAHALKSIWPEPRLLLLRTAVQYQLVNALGLLVLAHLAEVRSAPLLQRAAWLLLAGIVLFCLSLYALAAGLPGWIGAVTPVGGLCLIGAWLLAAFALWRSADQ